MLLRFPVLGPCKPTPISTGYCDPSPLSFFLQCRMYTVQLGHTNNHRVEIYLVHLFPPVQMCALEAAFVTTVLAGEKESISGTTTGNRPTAVTPVTTTTCAQQDTMGKRILESRRWWRTSAERTKSQYVLCDPPSLSPFVCFDRIRDNMPHSMLCFCMSSVVHIAVTTDRTSIRRHLRNRPARIPWRTNLRTHDAPPRNKIQYPHNPRPRILRHHKKGRLKGLLLLLLYARPTRRRPTHHRLRHLLSV